MDDSHEQASESGAMIGSNDDLLTEILLRLPVTSILRFKSVSKHWQWLLSDKNFTIRYDKLSKSSGLFRHGEYAPFDVENRNTPPSYKLYFGTYRYCFRIVQSCNGLLLCSSSNYNGDLKYYVFNPTTKQFATIPSVRGGYKVRKTIRFMGLAFHITDCVHYKVVCIRVIEPDGKLFQFQIYSSDTRKWKICREFFADLPYFGKGVYWNGGIYWAPLYGNHFHFQIEVERLQLFPLPVEMTSSDTRTMYIGESKGHLHLVVGYEKNTDLQLNVYEKLSDHSGWFVKYHVELHELPGAFPEMIYSPEVIDVVRGEKEEDTFMVLIIPWNIITYNVHDKSFKEISDCTCYSDVEFLNCHRCIESLSSF